MALEELEKDLYSKNPKRTGRTRPQPNQLDLRKEEEKNSPTPPTTWKEEPKHEPSTILPELSEKVNLFGRWFFWIMVAGAVIVLGLGAFYFYQYSTSKDLALNLTAPSNVLSGAPFNVQVHFANNSGRPAQDAKLSMTLPEGVFSPDDPSKRIIAQDVGDMAPGSSFDTQIPVVIYGQKDTFQRLELGISYYPPSVGPKVRFEKTATVDVDVTGPAIKLDLTPPPQGVLNGENFDIKLSYSNVSDLKFDHAQIEVNYPPDYFIFKSASPAPTLGNNIWSLDNFDKNASGTIDIQGSILAPMDRLSFPIGAVIKTNSNIIVETPTTSINIASPPLSLWITINNQLSYISKTNDTLIYAISYKNNSSSSALGDAVIKARLNSSMFDFSTLSSKGNFSSVDNSIIWNASNVPDLRSIAVGAGGTVDFTIRTKNSYPVRRLADKNFVLTVDAEITSPTVPPEVSLESDRTTALSHLEVKVAGQTVVQSQAFFTDPTHTIKNSGPLPPKVNKPTTYVVDWKVINYSTNVSNVQIKSTLPSGVRFTGNVKSNVPSSPVFNDRTSEVDWVIDHIVANKGIIGQPAEAVFQIEATPNITQAEQSMPLLNETDLTATDDFTSSTLVGSAPVVTTQLSNDPSVGPTQWTVQP